MGAIRNKSLFHRGWQEDRIRSSGNIEKCACEGRVPGSYWGSTHWSAGCAAVKEREEELSRYERQSGWEAAAGEWGHAVAQAQSLCGVPEGGDEAGVGVVEGLAGSLGRSMDERCRRAGGHSR